MYLQTSLKLYSASNSQSTTLQGQKDADGTLGIYSKRNRSRYSKHLGQNRTVQKLVGTESCDPWEREVFRALANCFFFCFVFVADENLGIK